MHARTHAHTHAHTMTHTCTHTRTYTHLLDGIKWTKHVFSQVGFTVNVERSASERNHRNFIPLHSSRDRRSLSRMCSQAGSFNWKIFLWLQRPSNPRQSSTPSNDSSTSNYFQLLLGVERRRHGRSVPQNLSDHAEGLWSALRHLATLL